METTTQTIVQTIIPVDSGRISLARGNNVYILFAWEAEYARPNCDPYSGRLRYVDRTGQVFTTDKHIKHHVRRGLKAYGMHSGDPALSAYYANPQVVEASIFYEKTNEAGAARTFLERVEQVRSGHGVTAPEPRDAMQYCLDLAMFGYVHAKKGENFSVTNAANTLFPPMTYHSCELLGVGHNNAFPGDGNESAGSSTDDVVQYGMFLSLWEFNLNMLKVNAEKHKLLRWTDDETACAAWIRAFINGAWRAYTSDRYPSCTQRSQFAQFIVGWHPSVFDDGRNILKRNPADFVKQVPRGEVFDHESAVATLERLLPDFLRGWCCTKDTCFASFFAADCELEGVIR